MRIFCAVLIAVFFLSVSGLALAEKPSGDTQKDIKRLFEIISEQKKIIQSQQKTIQQLEGKLAEKEEEAVERIASAVKEEVTPEVTTAATVHGQEEPGWFTTAAFSFMKPGGLDDINFVSMQHPSDSEGTLGEMYSIDFGWEPAWSGTFGRRYDNGNELSLSYWGSKISDSKEVSGDNLHAVLLHVETDEADDIDYAKADMNVDMHRVGIDFTHPFYENNKVRLAWSGGIRYIKLDQRLFVDYYDLGAQVAYLDAKVDNNLLGPRIGTTAEYAVNDNLSLTAVGGINLMAYWSKAHQFEGPLLAVDGPWDAHDRREGITPVIDTSLGMVYRPTKNWSIGLAYEFMWLHDVFALQQGLDDTSEGQAMHWQEDVTLHGITVDATLTF